MKSTVLVGIGGLILGAIIMGIVMFKVSPSMMLLENEAKFDQQIKQSKEAKSIDRFDVIYVYYLERNEYCDIQWTDIVTNATTRGIWDKWIEVDEHY